MPNKKGNCLIWDVNGFYFLVDNIYIGTFQILFDETNNKITHIHHLCASFESWKCAQKNANFCPLFFFLQWCFLIYSFFTFSIPLVKMDRRVEFLSRKRPQKNLKVGNFFFRETKSALNTLSSEILPTLKAPNDETNRVVCEFFETWLS